MTELYRVFRNTFMSVCSSTTYINIERSETGALQSLPMMSSLKSAHTAHTPHTPHTPRTQVMREAFRLTKRLTVSQLAIVITDGKSTYQFRDQTIPAADLAKRDDITMISLGMITQPYRTVVLALHSMYVYVYKSWAGNK